MGGNDGLNTVVPIGDPRYRRARPTLALEAGDALPIGRGMALHPSLGPLLPLWERGRLAVVQGVGSPVPSRSHFVSSAAWHAARPRPDGGDGWLGRTGLPALNVDPQVSPALRRAGAPPLSLRADVPCRLPWGDAATFTALYQEAPAGMRETWADLATALDVVGRTAGATRLPAAEPGPSLATVLAWMPRARVYHTSARGYDTHGGQAERHAAALASLAGALAAFWREVEARGWADDVTVLVYSEFGRRVEENASGGTDHGKAGPVLLLGGRVRGGLHGELPPLDDLDDGDLRCTVDFRRVCATVLERALEVDPVAVLGERFEPLQALR